MLSTKDCSTLINEFIQALLKATHSEPVDNQLPWQPVLEEIAHTSHFQKGETLVQQNAMANHLHFLIEGTLHYPRTLIDKNNDQAATLVDTPWTPIGWSSLSFPRYRATILAESDGRMLSLPLIPLKTICHDHPQLWAMLSEFIFIQSTSLLWQTRGTTHTRPEQAHSSNLAFANIKNPDPKELKHILHKSGSFASLPENCHDWLAEHSQILQLEPGKRVMTEGDLATGFWLLYSGKVELSFYCANEQGTEKQAQRFVARPGTLLCWCAISQDVPVPYTINTTRDTLLIYIDKESLKTLPEKHPNWVGFIFQQQIWQLCRYLQTTRSLYEQGQYEDCIEHLSHLIEDSKPILPVNSKLYGVDYLLKNPLTRKEGFDRLYQVLYEGNSNEQSIVGLALHSIHDLEREFRFFTRLQSTYSIIQRNSRSTPEHLRRITQQGFRDAFNHVPYVIKGMENLPDEPNCIFIYNHIIVNKENLLPNGFGFAIDSHFITSLITEPKYGDGGIRIVRASRVDEYWRDDYYRKLGNIFVHTPESGELEETAEEKKARKASFFTDSEKALEAGMPLIIAPEGTGEQEFNYTPNSPGPFKSGAFLLSGKLKSKPKIVPIAFANFELNVRSTVYSCVIKPAFNMDDRGVDVNDREALSEFLAAYQEEFRGHVQEAIELANQVENSTAPLDELVHNIDNVGTVYNEYESDVRALELKHSKLGGDKPSTVFYGSSSFRLWESLADDVGIPDAINLGFGGSTLEACRLYFETLLLPFNPERIILYAGDNDIGGGANADSVVEQFRQLADRVQAYLPNTQCWIISIKPSPMRVEHLEETQKANRLIEQEVKVRSQWEFIDIFPYMLDSDGRPNGALYSDDQLHMNIAGYGVWTKLIRQSMKL